ncbi:MAG: hypothetical protein Q4B52_05375, partial [Tissierellia bacterium]|nr:hypothetical protein [Tissierellia bacterium]
MIKIKKKNSNKEKEEALEKKIDKTKEAKASEEKEVKKTSKFNFLKSFKTDNKSNGKNKKNKNKDKYKFKNSKKYLEKIEVKDDTLICKKHNTEIYAIDFDYVNVNKFVEDNLAPFSLMFKTDEKNNKYFYESYLFKRVIENKEDEED